MRYSEFSTKFDEKCNEKGLFCDDLDLKVDYYINYILMTRLPFRRDDVAYILEKLQSGDVSPLEIRNVCADRGMEMTPSEVELGMCMYEVSLEWILDNFV